jgi:hypothetical protein
VADALLFIAPDVLVRVSRRETCGVGRLLHTCDIGTENALASMAESKKRMTVTNFTQIAIDSLTAYRRRTDIAIRLQARRGCERASSRNLGCEIVAAIKAPVDARTLGALPAEAVRFLSRTQNLPVPLS